MRPYMTYYRSPNPLTGWQGTDRLQWYPGSFNSSFNFARFFSLYNQKFDQHCFFSLRMGIHGLSKVIGDHAPSGSKENEIKNYFGESVNFMVEMFLRVCHFMFGHMWKQSMHVCMYACMEDITRWREDMNLMLEW